MKKIDLTFCFAIVGLVLCILAIVFDVIWLFLFGFILFCGMSMMDYYYDFYLYWGHDDGDSDSDSFDSYES